MYLCYYCKQKNKYIIYCKKNNILFTVKKNNIYHFLKLLKHLTHKYSIQFNLLNRSSQSFNSVINLSLIKMRLKDTARHNQVNSKIGTGSSHNTFHYKYFLLQSTNRSTNS